MKKFLVSSIQHRFIATLFSVFALAKITGCGDVRLDSIEPGSLIQTTARSTPAGLPSGTTTKLLNYRMEAVSGGLTDANALMFTPSGNPPAGGWPLVVWAHGTTGVADSCAPSSFAQYGDAGTVAPLLAQGMAVLAPDYEGLGKSGVHPYYIRKSHSLGVLRAVQAAMSDKGLNLAPRWSVIGHSQGGNVALAAAEDAKLIDGVAKLKAVVLLAPGSDLVRTSEDIFASIDSLEATGNIEAAALFTAFVNFNGTFVLQGAKAAQPTINVSSYFGARMQPIVDLALTEQTCGQFFNAIADDLRAWAAAGSSIASYPGVRRDWFREPLIAALLSSNRVGNVLIHAPIRVVQGTSDEQVPVTVTRSLVTGMRAVGNTVDLVELPDGDHNAAVSAEVLLLAAATLKSQLSLP